MDKPKVSSYVMSETERDFYLNKVRRGEDSIYQYTRDYCSEKFKIIREQVVVNNRSFDWLRDKDDKIMSFESYECAKEWISKEPKDKDKRDYPYSNYHIVDEIF